MIFGGTKKEHIQFNEKTVWTGDTQSLGKYQNFGISFDTIQDNTYTIELMESIVDK